MGPSRQRSPGARGRFAGGGVRQTSRRVRVAGLIGAGVLAAVALIWHQQAWQIEVGVALGLLAAFTPQPLTSLGYALRPLALPLVAALAMGTFKMPWPVQVLAGGAGVFAAWRLI